MEFRFPETPLTVSYTGRLSSTVGVFAHPRGASKEEQRSDSAIFFIDLSLLSVCFFWRAPLDVGASWGNGIRGGVMVNWIRVTILSQTVECL